MGNRLSSRTRAAALLCAVAVLLGACTDDAPSPEASAPTTEVTREGTSGTIEAAIGPLRIVVAKVYGATRTSERKRFRHDATQPVLHWLGNAYPGADPLEVRVKQALAPFTDDASRLASRQRAVTTLGALADGVQMTVATVRRISVKGFADQGRLGGATASVTWVLLCLKADGTQQEVVLMGDLTLTRRPSDRWAILGFQLQRSVGAPGTYAASAAKHNKAEKAKKQHQRKDTKPKNEKARR